MDRRNFLRSAGAAVAAAGTVLTAHENAIAQSLAEKARFDRLAACSYPLRSLFRTRQRAGRGVGQGATSAGPEGATGGPVVTVPRTAIAPRPPR